jgi:hypothetical protein
VRLKGQCGSADRAHSSQSSAGAGRGQGRGRRWRRWRVRWWWLVVVVVIAIPRATANVDATNGTQTAKNTAGRALTVGNHVTTEQTTRRTGWRGEAQQSKRSRPHQQQRGSKVTDRFFFPNFQLSQARHSSFGHKFAPQARGPGAYGKYAHLKFEPPNSRKKTQNYVTYLQSATLETSFPASRRASHRYCSCQSVTTA